LFYNNSSPDATFIVVCVLSEFFVVLLHYNQMYLVLVVL